MGRNYATGTKGDLGIQAPPLLFPSSLLPGHHKVSSLHHLRFLRTPEAAGPDGDGWKLRTKVNRAFLRHLTATDS